MNLRDLEYVVAVADHGHFGRAATACNVSQPTLSGQILVLAQDMWDGWVSWARRIERYFAGVIPARAPWGLWWL
jgi:Bacterial regulatory helix-turn-helix protein, lysR family